MSAPAQQIRILVADDEPVILDTYEAFLVPPDSELAPEIRIELVCCDQAEAAVAAVRDGVQRGDPFALAFLDVSMPPGPDGVWAAEQIRKLDSAIEITIVTAYSDISPAEITSRVPPAHKLLYLQKPFHPHEITQLAVSLGAKWLAERGLSRSLARLDTAQRIAQFGHWEYDSQSGEARWSEQMGRLFGISNGDGRGPLEALWQNVHPEDRARLWAGIERVLAEGQGPSLDYRICLPGGTERYIQHEVVTVPGPSEDTVRLVGAVLDLTERKRIESKIQYLAFHDPLTGLLNRSFLNQHMPIALRHVERNDGYAALLYLDLDHFKRINDTLGHSAGDDLLQEVARRITESVRQSDCVARAALGEAQDSGVGDSDPIARLGGDEFIVLLPEVRAPEDPARVAERIRSSLMQPFEISGNELHVSSSIGIALYPRDGREVETLLQSADLALYHAKDLGRNNYQFFTQTLNEQAHRRLNLENELRQALANDELTLHFQATVDAASGALQGAEALVRWQHPERGLLAPSEFITVAEETGLIVPLGEWVLREASSQVTRWQRAGWELPYVSVNISFRQFRDANLATRIEEVLGETGLPPERVVVEFTESALMSDSEHTATVLGQLEDLGLRSAMDDFGTGYSSLSYLKRLPIQMLKIDRSFVSGIDTDRTDAKIAKAIITLAQELELQVTAEGVERQSQLDVLRSYGCESVQGFLIGVPAPAEEFERCWWSGLG